MKREQEEKIRGRKDSHAELSRQEKGKEVATCRIPSTSPFSPEIVNVLVDQVKLPGYVRYDGSTDPTEHLNAYQGHMSLGAHSDASWCKNFALTMTGLAQT